MIICNDCRHKDMCKWKDRMHKFIGSMMDARPSATEEELEFDRDYFSVQFSCKKYLSESVVNPFSFEGVLGVKNH